MFKNKPAYIVCEVESNIVTKGVIVYNSETISPEEFKSRRKSLGLSKPDLARLWGVTRPWIQMLESGDREIKKWMDLALKGLETQKMLGGDS